MVVFKKINSSNNFGNGVQHIYERQFYKNRCFADKCYSFSQLKLVWVAHMYPE